MKLVPENAQHVGARLAQQDSFGFSDPSNKEFARHGGVVAVLADGMGGLEHGEAASRTAVHTFLATYGSKTEQETVRSALDRAVDAANEAVRLVARQVGSRDGVGTTLAAIAVRGSALDWVSVGDSAIYLYRDGRLSMLNTAHVHARDLDAAVAAGRISEEQALGDPDRDALTSYLGIEDLTLVDRSIEPFPLQIGDRLLLSSDGLFKTLTEEEITEPLRSEASDVCEALVRKTLAKQRKDQDNVTVLAMAVESDEPPTRQEKKRRWFFRR